MDVHGEALAAAADVLGRARDAVAQPRAAALAVAHLDRERERALAVAPAHVDAVEVGRREDPLLDRLAHPRERRARAHRVDAVAVARVVARGDDLEVVVQEVRAEADDRLVVGPAHVGEAAALHRDDALARRRAVAARQLLRDVLRRPGRRRASCSSWRAGSRASRRPSSSSPARRRSRSLSATAPVVPRSAHSWRIACCGASTLRPQRAIARYIQPRQRLRLGRSTP